MISLSWVSDYIDIADQDLEALAVNITKAGINVEKVVTNRLDKVVIGKVVTCKKHPDSDHLHICQVDVGASSLQQIVCGAPNVREGLKVIVALPGAVLPGDFSIKKSKIRGVESNGMLCALYELGIEEKTEATYAKGICELEEKAPVGQDALMYLGVADTLYELDVHKHRNNDCYYHIGFAYEIAAILHRKVQLPPADFTEIKDTVNHHLQLTVTTKKCPYYLAKMVTDVKIGESPEFIKRRLRGAGMRPINNVVDISNYVMLEYGQPLHFFDQEKLGNKIVVRNAMEGEEIVTLDGKQRKLSASDIVITDGVKPVCIAGVMGGLNTDVDASTKTIVIESAIFDAVSIRYTASHLDLKSEASIRYGKGLNYEYTQKALERACYLLQKYADAKVLTGIICHDEVDKTVKTVTFKAQEINQLLGITISEADIEVELQRLDFPYQFENGQFIVTIPKRRLDIDPYINDIAEEIGRLYGYQNLISTLPRTVIRRGQYLGDVKYRKLLSKRLRHLGLNEVKTYTLVSPSMALQFDYREKKRKTLPNPMSVDKSILRTSLLPSLYQVYQYNKARKVKDIFLYEISKTYDKNYQEESLVAGLLAGDYVTSGWTKPVSVDFYLVKGMVENILTYLGFKNRYQILPEEIVDLHPGISAAIFLDREKIGVIGRIHPQLCQEEVYVFELSMEALQKKIKPLKYKEAPRYPNIEKDMAFLVPRDVTSAQIETIIKRVGGRLLTDIQVFDVYTDDDAWEAAKSIAYHLTFQDMTRTLSEEEVMTIFNHIISAVTTELAVTLRDK